MHNLNCSDLIREYEEAEKSQRPQKKSSRISNSKKRKEALKGEATPEKQKAETAAGGTTDDSWESLVSCIETVEKKKGKLYASVCWYY